MNVKKSFDFYSSIEGIEQNRIDQAKNLYRILEDIDLPYIEIIETGASQSLDDGCFGLFLAHIAQSHGGRMSSVDIDKGISIKSQVIYKKYLDNFHVSHHINDSVEYLRNYQGSPTIVHLDSWDLDIRNPIPSMLHGFREFQAIEKKMPSGSLLIVDDNFFKGTVVYWNNFYDGIFQSTEEIVIPYNIVGKGSLIYHYLAIGECEWILIGQEYFPGPNLKLILQKK
jgi:hypothetical protein